MQYGGWCGDKMRSMAVGRGTKCAVWRWERSSLTTGPATVAGAGQQLFHRGIPPCAKAHGCSTKPFEEVWGKELLSWLASLIFLSQVAHRCLMLFVEGGDQGS